VVNDELKSFNSITQIFQNVAKLLLNRFAFADAQSKLSLKAKADRITQKVSDAVNRVGFKPSTNRLLFRSALLKNRAF
jgi:hypothetical protein